MVATHIHSQGRTSDVKLNANELDEVRESERIGTFTSSAKIRPSVDPSILKHENDAEHLGNDDNGSRSAKRYLPLASSIFKSPSILKSSSFCVRSANHTPLSLLSSPSHYISQSRDHDTVDRKSHNCELTQILFETDDMKFSSLTPRSKIGIQRSSISSSKSILLPTEYPHPSDAIQEHSITISLPNGPTAALPWISPQTNATTSIHELKPRASLGVSEIDATSFPLPPRREYDTDITNIRKEMSDITSQSKESSKLVEEMYHDSVFLI